MKNFYFILRVIINYHKQPTMFRSVWKISWQSKFFSKKHVLHTNQLSIVSYHPTKPIHFISKEQTASCQSNSFLIHITYLLLHKPLTRRRYKNFYTNMQMWFVHKTFSRGVHVVLVVTNKSSTKAGSGKYV